MMELTVVLPRTAALVLCLLITGEAFMWEDNQVTKQHRGKTLLSAQLQKVADMSEMAYFENQLLEPFMHVRVSGTPANMKVQEHIKKYMTRYGWAIEEDTFVEDTPLEPTRFTNIIATQNPRAARRLVLACHFDSKYFAHIKFIGATDSAVPCAMLLDVARHLNASLWAHTEDVSLQFVFFDGEEAFVDWTSTDSIYGARHLAEKWSTSMIKVGREEWTRQLDTIDVLVLLDLIGTKDPTFHNWFTKTAPIFELFQRIEMRLTKLGLLEQINKARSDNKYFTSNARYAGRGVEDDHIPFLHKNVPILHMIAFPFPKEWHTAADDATALHFPTIDNINKILRVFVCEYLHLSP